MMPTSFLLMSSSLVVMISSIICLINNSWLIIWVLMEMNLTMFFYNLNLDKKKEKLLMFFIFQSMASLSLLIYILWSNTNLMKENSNNTYNLILCAMIIKMGLYPFFMWATEISKILSWLNNTLMMTWQKIIPVTIMIKILKMKSMWVILLVSMLFMNSILLKISTIKMFFMVSSLIHSSWMLMTSNFMEKMPLMYLCIYSAILIVSINLISKSNSKSILLQNMNKTNKFFLMTSIFSLAGMPPTLGFLMKLLAFDSMLKMLSLLWIIMATTMIALLSFYCYIQMLYKNFLINYNISKHFLILLKKNNTFSLSMNLNLIFPTMMIIML